MKMDLIENCVVEATCRADAAEQALAQLVEKPPDEHGMSVWCVIYALQAAVERLKVAETEFARLTKEPTA